MKLATTTGDFERFYGKLEERIKALAKAGFKHIDLSLYNENTKASLFMQDTWQAYTNNIKACGQKLGIDFVQAHLPNVNPLVFDGSRQNAIDVTKRAIEVCGMLDIPNAVIHTGWAKGIGKEEYFEKNMPFLKELFPVMESTGVNVCIENSTKANMGTMYHFFTGSDMLEFINYAGHPLLHACWDTGHANIEGHQYEDIIALGNHLKALHINDNNGRYDEHIIPFMGSLNLDEVMTALADSGYNGPFTFESSSSILFSDDWITERHKFEKDTRLAQPPLFMQEQAEKMLCELGVYILKTYNSYED